MTTLPSLLLDIPESGHMWMCLVHKHFGYADTQDEVFIMSEEHYCHSVPAALHDACDMLRETWADAEDDDEALEAVNEVVSVIRGWAEMDGLPDDLFPVVHNESQFNMLLNVLHMASCHIILVDVKEAVTFYRQHTDEVTLYATSHSVAPLAAAQLLLNLSRNENQFPLGEMMADQIEEWLNSPEAK